MFKLEIQDNEKARFMVALLHDGAERWQLRFNALVKDGQEHTNLADVADKMTQKARALHQELFESFVFQMDAEADAALSTGGDTA